ncbi:uncharacterized protein LOC114308511 isoform X1 [Camellia sinensis]|uniref:uncharacterized protein LOC114308511 isoform X1 n=1 Tax=Camellia sinensis TaxID=4442 RepID=UPI0010358AE0|nr:uncharacterized protein LOC114308511 isoform X1 [Camellia sinensis]
MVEIEKNHGGNGEDRTMVQISLKTIGPSPPSLLNVPSLIKVQDLRKLIAGKAHLPIENLRLILQGNVLHDNKNGFDEFIQLNNEDSLIVAVKPKPPVKHIQDGLDEDDDEEDLKFQLPQLTSGWKRTLYSFLHNKLRLPDMLLIAIFSLSLKAWAIIVLWFIFAPVAHSWDLGPLYVHQVRDLQPQASQHHQINQMCRPQYPITWSLLQSIVGFSLIKDGGCYEQNQVLCTLGCYLVSSH